jgi:hypothetical protein
MGSLPNDVRTYFSKITLQDLAFYKSAFTLITPMEI